MRATMPTIVNGQIIEDLVLTFRDGRLASYETKTGLEAFEQFIARHDRTRFLGEIALVSLDSPLGQYNILFREILLDEKGRCHLALGNGYRICVRDSAGMNDAQLAAIGVNTCNLAHHDLMISSPRVNVTGITAAGAEVELLNSGVWGKALVAPAGSRIRS